GSNLKKYRIKTGLTQKEVATLLSVERSTYTKYETDVSQPCFAIIQKLTDIFGIDYNTIFNCEE
ncbi:MAG: helix-turn-helix transcriptional regulator, partial [Clostridia bacterium]|nr:helix-turn-helix transcriptional regulator [Clostridia bacterium]